MAEFRLRISSRDGYPLSAVLLESSITAKGAVQFCSGAGIKKEFYLHFARHLCSHGYHVMLFDYRGIGGSRPLSLRGHQALNHEWGQKDMAAILDWLDSHYYDLPKFLIGHSAGGQQLGLMDNHKLLTRALLISSSSGYWKWFAFPYNYFTLYIWTILAPVMLSTVGYLPSSWFGLGEDLPKGVAAEWRSWCLSKSYFGKYFGTVIEKQFFRDVTMPLHFLYPDDDRIATNLSVAALQEFYTQARITTEKIILKDHGLRQLGHFGFFSRKAKEKMWGKAVDFLHGCSLS